MYTQQDSREQGEQFHGRDVKEMKVEMKRELLMLHKRQSTRARALYQGHFLGRDEDGMLLEISFLRYLYAHALSSNQYIASCRQRPWLERPG